MFSLTRQVFVGGAFEVGNTIRIQNIHPGLGQQAAREEEIAVVRLRHFSQNERFGFR
ncbi:MAG: hypothetical protein V3R11_02695 [Nitrospirales bacterium]